MGVSIGSDGLLTFSGFKDNSTGSFLTNATVTAYLYDSANTSLATVTLTGGTSGNYTGNLSNTVTAAFVEGADYRVKFVGTQTGLTKVRWLKFRAGIDQE